MRKVYLIAALALIAIGTGVVMWRGHTNSPITAITKLFPYANHAATVTFGVIGDNEGDNATYRSLMQKLTADSSIQFILHLGDAMENGGVTEVDQLKNLNAQLGVKVPFYIVPGNHDLTDDATESAFQHVFGVIPRSIDIGTVHLVLLDNAERKVGFSASELSWLENDLRAWSAKKTKDDIAILAYHRPFAYPFASLLGDDETKTSRASNDKFLAILAKYPVNQIYAGHVHTLIDYDMSVAKGADGHTTQAVPVTVSGGGGGDIQSAFGGLLQGKFHALKVTVQGSTLQREEVLP